MQPSALAARSCPRGPSAFAAAAASAVGRGSHRLGWLTTAVASRRARAFSFRPSLGPTETGGTLASARPVREFRSSNCVGGRPLLPPHARWPLRHTSVAVADKLERAACGLAARPVGASPALLETPEDSTLGFRFAWRLRPAGAAEMSWSRPRCLLLRAYTVFRVRCPYARAKGLPNQRCAMLARLSGDSRSDGNFCTHLALLCVCRMRPSSCFLLPRCPSLEETPVPGAMASSAAAFSPPQLDCECDQGSTDKS